MKTIYVCELRSEELMIIAVIYAAFAVAKRKPEKNSGLYGIRTLISEIPVQRSTSSANKPKPAGSRSLIELLRYKPVKG